MAKEIISPNPTDCQDPGYLKKWAHTLPPFQAYMVRPPGY